MSQTHLSLKCHFRQPLITRDFACEHALEITYRDGPGIACQQEDAHQRCGLLSAALKAEALPALDMPDDLTVMPASVIIKIQYGGLIALSQDMGKNELTNNINALVASVIETYKNFDDLNYELIIQAIKDHKSRKRRKK